MEWLNIDQITFYSLVWLTGFLSSLFVVMENDIPCKKSIKIAGISGCTSFFIVGMMCGKINGPLDGQWYYIAVAAGIGLACKYQNKILKSGFKKFGINLNEY